MPQIRIIAGTVRGIPVENEVFESITPVITVADGSAIVRVRNRGRFPTMRDTVQISMRDATCAEVTLRRQRRSHLNNNVMNLISPESTTTTTTNNNKQMQHTAETDDQAMDRISKRFSILDQMTKATINGDIRAMIVSGPPGVGKSHGVITQLEKSSVFDRLAGSKIRFEIVKGALTALGLYATLYKYSDAKNVLVFDDADGIFADELSLNILKAALDSGKRRRIFWNSDSHQLRREGIPDNFEFRGSVIFITNIDFAHVKSKKLQDHLEALQSRCHFLDLTINSERDKMIRIKQVHRDSSKHDIEGLFTGYGFESGEDTQILDFMWDNRTKMRELSLRMALKIADLVKIAPDRWKMLAENTCMR